MRAAAPVVLAALLAGCGGDGATTVIRLAHGLNPGHSVHEAMVFMADRVAEKSGGTIRIDVYPSQQLGTERETIELLQIGSVGMTKVSASVLEAFVPVFSIFGLPYLFRDEAHRFAVLEGDIGRRLLDATGPARVVGLCYYDSGTRSFYTKARPIMRPEDLAGLKIRTQESPTAIRMVQVMGGSATPIAWGELYTALQQGIVDGAENNPPSFYLSGHYEVCPYYSLDEHTAVPDVLLISASVWADLPADARRWLREAADESSQYQKGLWQESSEDALRKLRAAGVQILEPDKAPFAEQVRPLYDEAARDPAMGALIEQIQAVP